MAGPKSNFLDKVLVRIGRLDAKGLQTVVERLARERRFLETLFNIIEDGVLVVDEEGRIVYFNHAVTELIGLQPETAVGQPIARHIRELDWEMLLSLKTDGVARHEFEVSYPKARFLRLYAAPLDGGGAGTSGVALILHDATEARQKTFEAIESERIQALTLLAASVAHEIGNPLNALHIHLQLMERELKKLKQWVAQPPARAARNSPAANAQAARDAAEIALKMENYLGVAKGEITRLDYIVTQFLQAIRPSPPQQTSASLNNVVRETLALLRPELENRGLSILEKLDRQMPDAPLDATQIKQVLVNLIKNAMHAMSTGGELTLETGHTPDRVWVEVRDTGVGIPREQISRIFEPFYTTKKKGTGLGLMIVHRIVRAHGGYIDVESDSGRGTVFRIWLPLRDRQTRLLEA